MPHHSLDQQCDRMFQGLVPRYVSIPGCCNKDIVGSIVSDLNVSRQGNSRSAPGPAYTSRYLCPIMCKFGEVYNTGIRGV